MVTSAVDAVLAVLPDGGPVEVTGDGALAVALRERLDDRPGGAEPAVVVETTGDAAAIVAATERVAADGTVVLAGPSPDAPVLMNLYADLHGRGLTVIGVPPER